MRFVKSGQTEHAFEESPREVENRESGRLSSNSTDCKMGMVDDLFTLAACRLPYHRQKIKRKNICRLRLRFILLASLPCWNYLWPQPNQLQGKTRMPQKNSDSGRAWGEQSSQTFIDYGNYFVPEREVQMQTLVALIPPRMHTFHVLELCCGEGLLAEAVLQRFTTSIVHGFDGSREMLNKALSRLARFGERFDTAHFDLAASDWRKLPYPVHAVLSSLAIHHLDGNQKLQLCCDIFELLESEGVFLIADVVQPAHAQGVAVAAEAWDEATRQRALYLDGDLRAFEYFQQSEWNMYRHPDGIDKPSGLFEQLQWLAQAGFVDIDVYWMKAGHAIFGGRKA